MTKVLTWPFHKHRWVEVDRRALWRIPGNYLVGYNFEAPRGPITIITERCVDQRCRKWRQKTLVGHLPGAKKGAADEIMQQL